MDSPAEIASEKIAKISNGTCSASPDSMNGSGTSSSPIQTASPSTSWSTNPSSMSSDTISLEYSSAERMRLMAKLRQPFSQEKSEKLKIRISDLNPHIVCSLCAGYFVDATTIVECLHSFCKSCIVKYLQTSKDCPQCNTKIHETKPLTNLKPDRALQDIVYKLVPNLYESEERKKREFYKARGLEESIKLPDRKESRIMQPRPPHSYRNDELVNICLEKHSGLLSSNGKLRMNQLVKKHLRCPVRTRICHLKTLLFKKLCIPEKRYQISILCDDEPMCEMFCMKYILLALWRPRDLPIMLHFMIKGKEDNTTK